MRTFSKDGSRKLLATKKPNNDIDMVSSNLKASTAKSRRRVDFSLHSRSSKKRSSQSPSFHGANEDLLNNMGQGIALIQDQYNPYTDNHYTNINVGTGYKSGTGVISDQTSAEKPAPNASRLKQKSSQLLQAYRKQKKAVAPGPSANHNPTDSQNATEISVSG